MHDATTWLRTIVMAWSSLTLLAMICDVRHQGTYCRESDTGHRSHGAGCPHHPTIICQRNVAVLLKTIKMTNLTDITFIIKTYHMADPKPYQASWNSWNPSPNNTVFLLPSFFISTLRSKVWKKGNRWTVRAHH